MVEWFFVIPWVYLEQLKTIMISKCCCCLGVTKRVSSTMYCQASIMGGFTINFVFNLVLGEIFRKKTNQMKSKNFYLDSISDVGKKMVL